MKGQKEAGISNNNQMLPQTYKRQIFHVKRELVCKGMRELLRSQ
jgi:hypothetical protein